MNDQLISRLKNRTSQIFRTMTTDENLLEQEAIHKSTDILRYDTSIFIRDDDLLFMSFHDEAGNANRHSHDFFEINYVVKGNPITVIDGHEMTLAENSLCIMNPNALHYFKEYRDDHDLILNIVLPKHIFLEHVYEPLLADASLRSFFIKYPLGSPSTRPFIYLSEVSSHAQSLIDMLLEEYLLGQHNKQLVIKSIIPLLFTYIFRDYRSITIKTPTGFNQIIDYIYEHYKDCTLGQVATIFGYHPKYLSSLIHNQAGMNFRNLLTQIRLQNAQFMLLETDLSIEEIAENIGYSDKSSFYSNFKKQYHTSPAKYRLNH